jgi:hypothetical protein
VLVPSQCLGQNVSHHVVCADISKHDDTGLMQLTNEVVLHVNVLGALMMHRILGESDAALKNLGRSGMRRPEFGKQLSEPEILARGVACRHVLCLC